MSSLIKSVSSIEPTIKIRLRRKRKKRCTPLGEKILFTISSFYDDEVKVERASDESTDYDNSDNMGAPDGEENSFIDNSELGSNFRPLLYTYPKKSPVRQIGKLDLDDLAKKSVDCGKSRHKRRRKRTRRFLSSSSESN